MNNDLYNILNDNYITLFNNYCKYNDKHKLINSKTCEDIFNDKIIYLIELNLNNPTIEIINNILCSGRKDKQIYNYINNSNDIMNDDNINENYYFNLDLLFINYRPKK